MAGGGATVVVLGIGAGAVTENVLGKFIIG